MMMAVMEVAVWMDLDDSVTCTNIKRVPKYIYQKFNREALLFMKHKNATLPKVDVFVGDVKRGKKIL